MKTTRNVTITLKEETIKRLDAYAKATSVNKSSLIDRLVNEEMKKWIKKKLSNMTGETKTCSRCEINQPLNNFGKDKRATDDLRSECKLCKNIESKKYRKNNPEKSKLSQKKYVDNNKEKVFNAKKNYRDNNQDKIKETRLKFNQNHPNYEKEIGVRYRKENPQKDKANKEKWKKANPEYYKLYRIKNKEKLTKKDAEYVKNRKKNDSLFKIKESIKTSIYIAIKNKGFNKKSRTHEILGCNYLFIKNYIESQWPLPHNLDKHGNVWMNWNNHGKYKKNTSYFGWDIDHKIPLSSANTEEELILLFKYTNLQPLCSYINRYIKKDRLDY